MSKQHPRIRTRQLFDDAVKFSPRELKKAMGEVRGVNAKIALVITHFVGSMACAYLFAAITLLRLPSAIQGGLTGANGVIVWFAQTFLQLVLLSIILVGQEVQAKASDARADHTFDDTEKLLDAMNVETEGGLKTVLDAINNQRGTK